MSGTEQTNDAILARLSPLMGLLMNLSVRVRHLGRFQICRQVSYLLLGGGSMRKKREIARRLVEVRETLFGTDGGPQVARLLDLPARTWANYERGVTMPGEILLGFVVATGVDPDWLMEGKGPMFRDADEQDLSGRRFVNH